MKRTSSVFMMLAACVAIAHAQQPSPQPPLRERTAALKAKGGSYYSGTERPLSASVIAQFVSWQPGELGLVVLWRGTERWYYASPRSGGGGGNAESYTHSNQFGSVRIDLTLSQTRRIAIINNVEVSLSGGENVLLVDGTDTKDRPPIRAIRADLSSATPAMDLIQLLASSNLAPIFQRSPEIVSFLQCEAPGNGGAGYICDNLMGK